MKSPSPAANNSSSSAFTLLEVIIAMTLFVILIGSVMQALTTTRNFIRGAGAEQQLRQEALEIIGAITDDLSSSAWYLPLTDEEKRDQLADKTFDRSLRYYPYVISQNNEGVGARFEAFRRTTDYIVFPESFTYWVPHEHLLPSQEIIFVKVSPGPFADDPDDLTTVPTNFDQPATAMSDFKTAPFIPSMSLVIIGTTLDGTLAWERDSGGRLREYGYAVIPMNGKHALVRGYFHRDESNNTDGVSSPSNPIHLHEVLSYNVDRIVIDTHRTSTGVAVDQVRIALYMSKLDESGQPSHYHVEATVAMRSTVDPEYSKEIDNWLGQSGDFSITY